MSRRNTLEGLILHAAEMGVELQFRPQLTSAMSAEPRRFRELDVVAKRDLGGRVLEVRKHIGAELLRRDRDGVMVLADAREAVQAVLQKA